uniref:Uncharacterized protein n=1 Tax=Acrobeloides nanus TaxID=290746 RepID=A0A914CCQ5_9BILA
MLNTLVPKGEKTVRYKKGAVSEKWKRKIVEDAIERKRTQGPGDPISLEENDDGIADVLADLFDELMNFEDAIFEEEYEFDEI